MLVVSSLLRRNEDNPPWHRGDQSARVKSVASRKTGEEGGGSANSLPNRFEYPGHGPCAFERVNATFQRPPR